MPLPVPVRACVCVSECVCLCTCAACVLCVSLECVPVCACVGMEGGLLDICVRAPPRPAQPSHNMLGDGMYH